MMSLHCMLFSLAAGLQAALFKFCMTYITPHPTIVDCSMFGFMVKQTPEQAYMDATNYEPVLAFQIAS